MKQGKIISALRWLWLKSPERNEALKAARVRRGRYQCAECGEEFKRQDINIHHIKPVDKFKDWNTYIKKLFCVASELKAVCILCHEKIHHEEKRKDENKKPKINK